MRFSCAGTSAEVSSSRNRQDEWVSIRHLGNVGGMALYRFPKPHWKGIRTTNVVENAVAVVWKVLTVPEGRV